MRRQDLDRDVPAELAVAGAIDLAHAAGAERRQDRVRPDLPIQHAGTPGNDGRGGRFEKPRRVRFIAEQRLDVQPQRLVAITRLLQERGALLWRARERRVIEVRDRVATIGCHTSDIRITRVPIDKA